MGCICSKRSSPHENDNKSAVQMVAPASSKREEIVVSVGCGSDGSVGGVYKANGGNVTVPLDERDKKTVTVERPSRAYHQRRATTDIGTGGGPEEMFRIISIFPGVGGEEIAAGWPSWLASVAADAIQGWVPRRAESFQKLNKIGEGTYSSVFKARDLETEKIVAMKMVRFVNMDPESVRFMAREICILRKLDHPNVMKLNCLVTSRMSCSLYLVFDYMEHDLAGLAATPGLKFTEQQIKCYMQQLLRGLEHCHSRGVLHRDIKGSNLLIDNNGFLKIGDFGLSTFYQPDQGQPLTSRVVTLWYRAPELLLGATQYGVAIDLWSTGCILAELFAGKPIMPGSTEVEQLHKILKLCGSPSEDYWRKAKFCDATSFKSRQSYKRCLLETFKHFPPSALTLVDKLLAIEPENRGSAASALSSRFFTTEPLPCHPSSLPKYSPSKELDIKRRNEEARQNKEAVRGHGPESVRRGSRNIKEAVTPEFIAQQSKPTSSSHNYNPREESRSGFPIEPPGAAMQNHLSHSSSMIHSCAVGSRNKNGGTTSKNNGALRTQRSHVPQEAADMSTLLNMEGKLSGKESAMGYVPKKNRIHCSGPLMPPGGNTEDILKEHERQIQQAFRKARHEKSVADNNCDGANQFNRQLR
ncbi:Pkinase domain-containing protein [Cephalotus follicularis]|uniref:Pkinase domain-containing protein n=1 Tax=Cephalotus follicularis TaxID=3775 RepID=A0A1Q3CXU5_CEPFO|nr:Pkinase domain-containing protein [Cephalotus follicularis]